MHRTNAFSSFLTFLFISSLGLLTQVSAQTYTITNNCPTAIDLFIGQESQGSLDQGQSVVKTGLGTSAGFFYTRTNGGVEDDGDLVAARAGFYFEPNYWYYYLVRDDDSLNTGISITPDQPPNNGFCTVAVCETANCTTAFTSPPVFHGPVPPPPDGPAPNPPLYQCRVPGTNFLITFCPSGQWPAPALNHDDDDHDDDD